MESRYNTILVTGGAGFIGSNFIRYIFEKTNFHGKIVNIDKLTYAGNLENLADIHEKYHGTRYFFEKIDICDYEKVEGIFKEYSPDAVVHFAAESHVDRSIHGPKDFINTNIIGTFNLLEVARKFWLKNSYDSRITNIKLNKNDSTLHYRFHHISTDEVYGSLGDTGYFYEDTPYDPRSPYSASKASSDHLVMAYYYTYGLDVVITNCSNNYGPYQFPEKLIPLMILNMLEGKPLPVYGDGKNIRDWLYVEDHCSGVWIALNKGRAGERYNIGGENEWQNIALVNKLCEIVAEKKGRSKDYYKKLITFVKDRPGHDRRYAINCDKIKKELGWSQSVDFETGLQKTVDWYIENQTWVENVRSGEYMKWMKINYGER
ncbi:dTDP-glucose 4,6-dehydratase [Desulfothermus okinawensis JCM 13304]